MKTSSAKSKGRFLQKLVVGKILKYFPSLSSRDVVSTSMGVNGSDVKLSDKAVREFPFSIECKNLASIAIYKHYKQAEAHALQEFKDTGFIALPLLVVKQNRSEPLVVLSMNDFFEHFYGG